jgi:hypothetical protein
VTPQQVGRPIRGQPDQTGLDRRVGRGVDAGEPGLDVVVDMGECSEKLDDGVGFSTVDEPQVESRSQDLQNGLAVRLRPLLEAIARISQATQQQADVDAPIDGVEEPEDSPGQPPPCGLVLVLVPMVDALLGESADEVVADRSRISAEPD